MPRRKIVEIDESKCDGCGQCVPSCAEGAIQIINGKARLVSDVYCDGLGACLGHCPQDAIRVVEREAPEFDEAAVQQHQARQRNGRSSPARHHGACPGSAMRQFSLPLVQSSKAGPSAGAGPWEGSSPASSAASQLTHWPVQLHLVPPAAPFLRDADVLLVADCVPFAMPDFHAQVLRGRPVLIGCPKLDDGQYYVEKLAAMLRQSGLRSLTVVHMEVPCCMGLVRIAAAAKALAAVDVPLDTLTVSIRGRLIEPPVAAR
jgi:Pyruvate/2-oxoacid:ferredoxin oxidoreductase delta subunit